MSGAASGGIGIVAQSVTTSIFGTFQSATLNWMALAVTRGMMHGMAQGIIQGVTGGDAGQSFLVAMATSIAGSAFQIDGNGAGTEGLGWGDSVRGSIGGQALFGAVVGGTTSHLQGGNFWEGATIGLTVSLLNCAGNKLYPAIDRLLQRKDGDIDLYKLFKGVLANKEGTTLTADEIIKKYHLPAKLKNAINSIKVISKNKIYVDWNSEETINTISKINVKDGILSIRYGFIPTTPGAKLGLNGFIISGDGLNYQPSLFSSKNFSPVFVSSEGGIYGYFMKTNTRTPDGASL